MSDYPYQHNIYFQYTFGSTACLIYLTAVNLADFKTGWHRFCLCAAAALICAVCFGNLILPKAIYYPTQCTRSFAHYQSIRQVLSQIPEDASVTATAFYTTYLSQREILYDVKYASRAHLLETEYVVLNISASNDFKKYTDSRQENGFENLVTLLEENGYAKTAELDDVLVICRRA